MPAYLIANVEINDTAKFTDYMKAEGDHPQAALEAATHRDSIDNQVRLFRPRRDLL